MIMQTNNTDWKDVVATYFDKCLAITLLFTIFAFIVFPEIETKAVIASEKIQESIEILPDMPERIEQPQEVAKPIVSIEIIDDESDKEDDEILFIDTIDITILDQTSTVVAPPSSVHGETPKFVIYEDPPVIVRRVPPTFPDVMRRTGMTGTVTLDIEVLADGSIGAIEVVRSLLPGPGGADEAAVAAVRQWEIQPAKSGGKAVACWFRQPIVFELQR